MKKCLNCGTEFEGQFCPECGSKWQEEKICPNCGSKLEANVKFCNNCGYDFNVKPVQIQQVATGSAYQAPAKVSSVKLSIIASVIIALVLVMIIIWAVISSSSSGINGIYYEQLSNGQLDKNSFIELKSGKWSDNDDASGTYKKDGDKYIFYVEFFGSNEELTSGTIEDGVLTLNMGGVKQKYVKEDK